MSGNLTFNGTSAASLGLSIGSVDVYAGPIQSANPYSVPGRIGEVLPSYDLSRVPNQIITYDAALFMRAASNAEVAKQFNKIRHWLLSPAGYQTLTDTYDTAVYRKAYVCSDIVPVRKGAGQNFVFQISFSCDPRRFLSGVTQIELEGTSQTVTTPTTINGYTIAREGARPLIKFSWTGTAKFVIKKHNSATVIGSIILADNTSNPRDIWYDAETGNASYNKAGTSNANSQIEAITGDIRIGPEAMDLSWEYGAAPQAIIDQRYWVR